MMQAAGYVLLFLIAASFCGAEGGERDLKSYDHVIPDGVDTDVDEHMIYGAIRSDPNSHASIRNKK